MLPACLLGVNIFYLVLSVHTFIHEDILVQALGLERKQCAYRVLLPSVYLVCYWLLTKFETINSLEISLR